MTSPIALFDQIRGGAATVAEQASHVFVDRDRLAPYAASLPLAAAMAPQLDAEHHFVGTPAETVAFVITLDSINFGSGYFPWLQKRPGLSGYFTVATSLTERFRAAGPYRAEQLIETTATDCAALFGQNLDRGPVEELMGHFSAALNELGRFVVTRFDGEFVGLVEAAEQSAEQLVRLLAEMPYFADVEPYRGFSVPFYKRAQLSAADLALALPGHPCGRFTDLDRLTIFADNLVPHVLRVDGVLRYDEDLARRIDTDVPIEAGSPEEVEIRACALHAVELLTEACRATGQPVTAMGLDYVLWNRGQQPYYKARPRHRTRTVFY